VPLGCEPVPTGSYQLSVGGAPRDGRHVYRPGHPLAEFLIGRAASRRLEPAKIIFDYSTHRQTGKISLVEELLGKSGYLLLTRVSVRALEREDHLVFGGRTDSGKQLESEVFEKLFNVDGRLIGSAQIPDEVSQKLDEQIGLSRTALLARVAERNSRFFEEEIEKLERWAEDLKDGLEQELKELDTEIKGLKKQAKLQVELESKLELHRKAKELEVERSRKRRTLFDAQDEIDRKKESLISEVEGRLQQRVETEPLFAIRWEVK
jgi:adenine-specific DNA-methyltransferase